MSMRFLTKIMMSVCVASTLYALPVLAEDTVDLNTADASEIEKLPGVGAATAKLILEYRDQNGSFSSVEELLSIKGVTQKTVDKLRALVSFGKPKTAGIREVTTNSPATTKEDSSDVGPSTAQLKKILGKYKDEPSVLEVQTAATRFAQVYPELIASWRTRASWAAIGPEIRGEYRYVATDDSRNGSSTSASSGTSTSTQLTNGAQHRPLGRVVWHLDQLIFNPDELRVSNEAVDLVRLRESVLDQVTKIYYERRRLQVELDMTPPKDLAGRVRKELRLQELVADLDSLTGGFFSEKLVESGINPY